jgi:hypothetical protein
VKEVMRMMEMPESDESDKYCLTCGSDSPSGVLLSDDSQSACIPECRLGMPITINRL